MSGRNKQPVRLTGLLRVRAARRSIQSPAAELPAAIVMEFGHADGPAAVSDGRECRAVLAPAELAQVIGAIPAACLDSDSMFASLRVQDLLNGIASRYAGVRLDDLRAVLGLLTTVLPQDAVLRDQDRAALRRFSEIARTGMVTPASS